jgi:hypothetical protein
MAVMLRTLGIPARVAVGYTGGRFDPDRGSWVVVDRDAHSWVEVFFSGHGWVPFDPTPGRAVASPASVSSPSYAPVEEALAGGVVEEAVDPPAPAEALPGGPGAESGPEERKNAAALDSAEEAGGSSRAWGAGLLVGALALALAAAAPMLARATRRARRQRRGSEAARVLAAAAELEGELSRLGAGTDPSATAAERADAISRSVGVDAHGLYELADRARYGAGPMPPGSARRAWRLSDLARRRLRRRLPLTVRLRAAIGVRAGRPGTLHP